MSKEGFAPRIVDAHVAVGAQPHFVHTRVALVLRDLDAASVDFAVLGPFGHWAAVDNRAGNEVLAGWVREHGDRLAAYATVNPWYSDAVTELRRALDDGLCGLKLVPAQQGFNLLSPLLEPVLDAIEEYERPVYVVTGIPVVSEPLQLAELALRRPEITFVMGRSGRTDFSLDLVPALETAPNILAETAYNGAGLVTDLVHRLGAERVLFASDAPFNDLTFELERVGRAILDEGERAAVMAGTAVRLFDLEGSAAMTFIDMHTHLPSESSAAWRTWSQTRLLEQMDALGVDRSVVMTLDGLAFDAVRGNDVLAKSCSGSGGRLLPFGSVDPRRPDAAEEVRRCATDLGFLAIKLHPWMQGFSPLAPYMTPVAEAAIEHDLPLVFHDGTPPYASPLQIAHLASRFPRLTVVLAHGGLFDMWQDAVAAARRHPNVHITICGTAPLAVFRRIVELTPADRISMGTDTGFGDPDLPRHFLRVHRKILSEQTPERAAALSHANAERLLGLR